MRALPVLAVLLFTVAACARENSSEACVPVLAGWATPQTGQRPYLIPNLVRVTDNQIKWNGVQVNEPILGAYLRESARMNPMPFVVFDPETGDCAFARRVRDIIDRSYPCSDGACGQGTLEAFRSAPFRKRPGPPA